MITSPNWNSDPFTVRSTFGSGPTETERVIEVKSDTVKFAEGGDHGNMETISKYKNNEIPSSAFNSKTVYSSSELGLETTGG